jgi:hypothetical protein
MAQTVTGTNFTGDLFKEFLRAAVQRAETLEQKCAAVHVGFNEALFFPKIALTGNIMQDYDPTGVDSGAVGTFTATDSTTLPLLAQSIKINNIDPNDWRDFLRPFQLNASDLYTWPKLPRAVQTAYLLELLEEVDWTVEQNMWIGDTVTAASAPTDRWIGWLPYLTDQADFIDATTSGATTFTSANVFGYMDTVYSTIYSNAVMKAVESRRRAELKIFVSKATATLLNAAESDTSGKGQTRLSNNGIYDMAYNGVKIVPLSAFPDDEILVTYADSNPRKSNLHFGMTNLNDKSNVQVFNMANGSNYMGMRMDMSAGCVVGYSTECVRFGASLT